LILDGTVVRARLDKRVTVDLAPGGAADGQKVLLTIWKPEQKAKSCSAPCSTISSNAD
jgi:hypothetical protein